MTITKTAVHNSVAVDTTQALSADAESGWRKSYLLKLNWSVLSLILLSSSIGYDGTLMNALQILPQWNAYMDHPTGAILGLINALYWIGFLLAFPSLNFISTRYGRKPGLHVGIFFLVVGVAVQTGVENKVAFTVARVLLGAAAGFWATGAPLLLNEIAFPTHRAVASALFMCGFYVGAVVVAWVTYAIRNDISSWGWRLPCILQLLCPVLALPGILACPESPRWMVASGKADAARAMLVRHHACGDAGSELVAFELAEIENAIRTEQEAQTTTSYLDMTKTPGNRHRLLISVTLAFFSQFAGNNVVSYYLAMILTSVGVTDTGNQLIIAGCLQVWNLGFAVAAAAAVEKLGRRVLFLLSAGITLVSYIIITALSAEFAQRSVPAVGLAVVPFLFIFFAGYDIALTPLVVAYPAEIWPYGLRMRGLTVSWFTGIGSILFMTFVSPIALESIQWKYYFVFLVVLIAYVIVVYFYYPETKGHTLEQMAVVFDGEDAAGQIWSNTEEKEKANTGTHHEGRNDDKEFA